MGAGQSNQLRHSSVARLRRAYKSTFRNSRQSCGGLRHGDTVGQTRPAGGFDLLTAQGEEIIGLGQPLPRQPEVKIEIIATSSSDVVRVRALQVARASQRLGEGAPVHITGRDTQDLGERRRKVHD